MSTGFARYLQDLPIRQKLRAIILIISGAAVVGSCAAFIAYDYIATRSTLAQQLEIMADVVGDQSAAALEFDQAPQAETLLRSLKAERQIVVAALYARDGRLFARYLREGADPSRIPALAGPDGRRFGEGGLHVYQAVRSGGERIGTFYLHSDLADARRRLLFDLMTVALVAIGATVAVLLLSRTLGGVVTEPVLRLSEVVQAVSQRRDYSLRAESRGRDELGRLIEGFNDMLAQIQARDDALARARDELEKRVEERTRELVQEVAERKAAEQRLQEKDARLIEAQEISRLGSWEWDLRTNRVSLSDEVYRLWGILPARFPGGPDDFVKAAHPDDREALRTMLHSASRTRDPFALDYRVIRPEGAVLHLHAQGKVALDEEGRPVRLVGTIQDITERKRADRAIQDLNRELQARMTELAAANKELEGFSYSVSHDLRAPLRSMDGFSRLLLEEYAPKLDARGRNFLERVCSATARMGELIDDFLALARVTRAELKMEAVDLSALAERVGSELRKSHPERNVELLITPGLGARGDSQLLKVVLENLLGNAWKFTGRRAQARIEFGKVSQGADPAFFVRDNGAGFDMAYVKKLFRPFERLHEQSQFAGTGVGLATVQRIIDRHGGKVWAEGEVDKGAAFYFTVGI